jgi:hypothetical protein
MVKWLRQSGDQLLHRLWVRLALKAAFFVSVTIEILDSGSTEQERCALARPVQIIARGRGQAPHSTLASTRSDDEC